MFIYRENYVGKQTSSNCEDAVHICILFCKKKINWVNIDPCCADVCAFLSMMMRVKAKLKNRLEVQICIYGLPGHSLRY